MNEEINGSSAAGTVPVSPEAGSPGRQESESTASRRELAEFLAGCSRFYRLYSCRDDGEAKRELVILFRRAGNLLSGAGNRLFPSQRHDVKKYLRKALDTSCFGSDSGFRADLLRLCGGEPEIPGEEEYFQKIRDYAIAGETDAGEGMDFIRDAEGIAAGFRLRSRRSGGGLKRYILRTGLMLILPLCFLYAVLFIVL